MLAISKTDDASQNRGVCYDEATEMGETALAIALLGGSIHHHVCVKNRPRDVVAELNLRHLLDHAHAIDRHHAICAESRIDIACG